MAARLEISVLNREWGHFNLFVTEKTYKETMMTNALDATNVDEDFANERKGRFVRPLQIIAANHDKSILFQNCLEDFCQGID